MVEVVGEGFRPHLRLHLSVRSHLPLRLPRRDWMVRRHRGRMDRCHQAGWVVVVVEAEVDRRVHSPCPVPTDSG